MGQTSHSRAQTYFLHLFLLIPGIRHMYKFIILSIENKQIDFLMVLEFIPSSYDVNKVVIKSIMHAKNIYIFFFWYFQGMLYHAIYFLYIYFL